LIWLNSVGSRCWKISVSGKETDMSSGEVAYLALIIAAFLFFVVGVGGLQYWLSREPGRQAEKSAGSAGARRAH
jgi:hypothetical protein